MFLAIILLSRATSRKRWLTIRENIKADTQGEVKENDRSGGGGKGKLKREKGEEEEGRNKERELSWFS